MTGRNTVQTNQSTTNSYEENFFMMNRVIAMRDTLRILEGY